VCTGAAACGHTTRRTRRGVQAAQRLLLPRVMVMLFAEVRAATAALLVLGGLWTAKVEGSRLCACRTLSTHIHIRARAHDPPGASVYADAYAEAQQCLCTTSMVTAGACAPHPL